MQTDAMNRISITLTPVEFGLLNEALTVYAHRMPARREACIAFAQTHGLPMVIDVPEPTPEEDR